MPVFLREIVLYLHGAPREARRVDSATPFVSQENATPRGLLDFNASASNDSCQVYIPGSGPTQAWVWRRYFRMVASACRAKLSGSGHGMGGKISSERGPR